MAKGYRKDSYLPRQHSILYQTPPLFWQDGLIHGNGDLGAISYCNKRSFRWGLTKLDCWDRRFEGQERLNVCHEEILGLVKQKNYDELERLFHATRWAYSVNSYPYPKACGVLILESNDLDLYNVNENEYTQVISIAEGHNLIVYQTESLWVRIESFVEWTQNVFRFRMQFKNGQDIQWRLKFYRWLDPVIGKPEYSSLNSHDGFLLHHEISEGFSYAVSGKLDGIRREWHIDSGTAATVETSPSSEGEFGITIAVSSGYEKPEVPKEAMTMLEKACLKSYSDALQKSKEGWKKFWRRSSVQLSDPWIERIFYNSLYLLTCISRGSQPAGVAYPCLWDYMPYHSDYHGNGNMQEMHWGLFASNHLDLVKPVLETYFSGRHQIKRDTEKYFGIPGMKFPHFSNVTCEEMGDIWARYQMHTSGWFAEMYWWYYQFSQDRRYLKKIIYPILREVAIFYQRYLTEDEDGKLSTYPSISPEQGQWWIRNPAIDRAFVKVSFESAIKASEILKCDEEDRNQWRSCLERLASYPNDGDVLLDYDGAPKYLPLKHPALLAGVFSSGEINPFADKNLYTMAEKTFENILERGLRKIDLPYGLTSWNDDLNPSWLICLAARLKQGNKARDYLYDLLIFQQLRPNGMFAEEASGGLLPQYRRLPFWASTNTIGGALAGITEMLIQSHAGPIEVFPATPEGCSGRFSGLLARGGFEVSTEVSEGKVLWIKVKSLHGNPCKVLSPWPGQTIFVEEGRDESKKTIFKAEDVIGFDTRRGGVYRLSAENKAETKNPAISKIDSPVILSYFGPQFLAEQKGKFEEITLGRKWTKKKIYRWFPDDGSLYIHSDEYTIGNKKVFLMRTVDTGEGDKEHGLPAPIFQLSTWGGPDPTFVEYWIETFREIETSLEISYGHALSRPVSLFVNEEEISNNLFEVPTGSIEEEKFKTERIELIRMSQGINVVRLESYGNFPRLGILKFILKRR